MSEEVANLGYRCGETRKEVIETQRISAKGNKTVLSNKIVFLNVLYKVYVGR